MDVRFRLGGSPGQLRFHVRGGSGGELPSGRRAAEDVGLANPNAIVVASSATFALQNMGIPEGLIPLSNAIIYVCESEKSNSVVVAMGKAKDAATKIRDDNVPSHLKNSVYASKDDKQKSRAYKYPHDYGGYVEQQYLPTSIKDKIFVVFFIVRLLFLFKQLTEYVVYKGKIAAVRCPRRSIFPKTQSWDIPWFREAGLFRTAGPLRGACR